MGLDVTGHVVLGVRMDDFSPYQVEQVRGSVHELAEGVKFCGICGSPAFIDEDINRPGFEDGEVKQGPTEHMQFFDRDSEFDDGVFGVELSKTGSHRGGDDMIKEIPRLPEGDNPVEARILEFLRTAGFEVADDAVRPYLVVSMSY